jgi:hypothetical protein
MHRKINKQIKKTRHVLHWEYIDGSNCTSLDQCTASKHYTSGWSQLLWATWKSVSWRVQVQQFLQTEPIQVILLSGTYHIYLYIIYIYRISYVCMYGWMDGCMYVCVIYIYRCRYLCLYVCTHVHENTMCQKTWTAMCCGCSPQLWMIGWLIKAMLCFVGLNFGLLFRIW